MQCSAGSSSQPLELFTSQSLLRLRDARTLEVRLLSSQSEAFNITFDQSGDSFHSSEWNPEAEIAGKRVGIVGSAASAVQVNTGL